MLPKNEPYLIGETAFHHEGDKKFLKELIDTAFEANLNAIKFHLLLDLDDYMVANHEAIEILRPWCFNVDDWEDIIPYAIEKGLEIVLLCNDGASIRWVLQQSFDIRAIEIHATGLNDYFLLKEASKFKGTVILGTGGSTLDEIQYAIDFLKLNGQQDIFLMHGFQNYPTEFKDINLSKMNLISNLFKLPVGYADHTDPFDEDNETISVLASAMGFNVLEKHFTHRFGDKRIDAQAAVSIAQIKKIKRLLEKSFATYGFDDLRMSAAELKYGNTGPMKKAIVARRFIKEGTIISIDDIAFKRTNESSTLKQLNLNAIIGLKTNVEIKKDDFVDFSKVEFIYQIGDISQFNNSNK